MRPLDLLLLLEDSADCLPARRGRDIGPSSGYGPVMIVGLRFLNRIVRGAINHLFGQ